MLTKLRNCLTYANVVSTLCLFILLGGSAVAAATLSKNSVRSQHIKNGQVKRADLRAGAVNSAKVRDGSLLAQDFAPGQLPRGEQGPPGVQGAQGPPGLQGEPGQDGQNGTPGSAVAYAHVNADGTLDAARSKNITSSGKHTVGGSPATGSYCISASVPVNHVVGSLDNQLGEIATHIPTPASIDDCPAGTDARVFTSNSAGALSDRTFWVLFN